MSGCRPLPLGEGWSEGTLLVSLPFDGEGLREGGFSTGKSVVDYIRQLG
jgi:hypothetical protein